jgi:hypothetical protein
MTPPPTATDIGRSVYFVDPRAYRVPSNLDTAACAPYAIPPSEVSRSIVEAPGDRDAGTLYRIARIEHAVIQTYNVALTADLFSLQIHIANFDPDLRFFAIEGATMGLVTREVHDPETRGWVDDFVARIRPDHVDAAYVGCGLGLAMLNRPHAKRGARAS